MGGAQNDSFSLTKFLEVLLLFGNLVKDKRGGVNDDYMIWPDGGCVDTARRVSC